MIYSIGYQGRTVEEIVKVMDRLGVGLLMDVRSAPYSKYSKTFGRQALTVALGGRYEYRGDHLGGFSKGISHDALRELAELGGGAMLLCMERRPCACHRHYLIGMGLMQFGVDVHHVCEGGTLTTRRMIEAGCSKKGGLCGPLQTELF